MSGLPLAAPIAWRCGSCWPTTTTWCGRASPPCSPRSTRSSWSTASADPQSLLKSVRGAPAGRRAHRHPDAADPHHRGHRRRQADPGRAPVHRRGRAVAVRRGGLRLRAARRRGRRARLPAQGAGLRRRRARPRPERRRPRRLRARPEGRRGADDAQGRRGELAPARADREGARGAGADGDRPQQRDHRHGRST